MPKIGNFLGVGVLDKFAIFVAGNASRRLFAPLAAMAFALLISVPAMAASPDGQSLLQAEQARFQAMVGADVDALDNLLADEAMYYHTTGWAQTKAEHIGHIAERTAVYRKIDIQKSKETVIGDVGIIEGEVAFTAGPTTPISYALSFITVYVWRDDRWQMLTFHCARIPEGGSLPPGPPPGAAPPPGPPPAP